MTNCPAMVATWSFARTAVEEAITGLRTGGSAIDAVELVCRIIEADPEIDSVGFGGLPDASGEVSLDACVMSSPAACGSVCAMRRHLHVARIARRVMERTAHVMLAGEAADRFAEALGESEAALCAPAARERWESWKTERASQGADAASPRRDAPERPVDRGHGALFAAAPPSSRDASGGVPEDRTGHFDTIGVLALDEAGAMAGACSTSGMPWKVPGRVGDSPIIGHGLYVDPQVGAVTATGHGELIMRVCGSFLAVERMRGGDAPLDALLTVLHRITQQCAVGPRDQVALIALRPDGTSASAALRRGFKVVRGAPGGEPGAVTIGDPDAVLLADG